MKSDFFRAALSHASFREAQENVVRPPEDDVEQFACYFEWLYNGDRMDTGRILGEYTEERADSREDSAGHTDKL